MLTCGPPGAQTTSRTDTTFVTPSITLTANGSDRRLGEDFSLQWQSYADTCIPSGGAPNDGWTGAAFANVPVGQGTFNPHVTTLGTYQYTLRCMSGPISVTQSVTVTFENDPPYVTASIDRTSANIQRAGRRHL